MRASQLIALIAVVAPVVVLANPSPEPCSDHPGVIHDPEVAAGMVAQALKLEPEKTSTHKKTAHSATKSPKATSHASKPASGGVKISKPVGGSSWKGSSTETKKNTHKVNSPSKNTLDSGASKAVGQFGAAGYLPKGISSALSGAISDQINSQLGGSSTTVSVSTHTSIHTYHPTGAALAATATPNVVTVTSLVPVTVTKVLSGDGLKSATALDIQAAINSAFAAVNMSQNGLNSATIASLESCLTTVLAAGGLPDGYACLTSSGSNSAGLQSTLNTILEQFVGILPNKILEAVFGSVTPLLTDLLPASESTLVSQIVISISSVIATLSGSSVTALEQVSKCYTSAIQAKGNTSSLACFTSSAENTITTATNSVLQQFIGVLPASLTTSVENILTYNLANSTGGANPTLAAKVQAQISNAINSAASTLSGNTVTLAETLQACASELIATGNATAAELCVKNSAAPTISMTVVNGISEQFQGYLPSSFFTDLVQAAEPLLANKTANPTHATEAKINAAFESYFNNPKKYGAAYVTCIEQVEKCVTNAVIKSGTIDAVCPGPVAGCTHLQSTSKAKRAFSMAGHSSPFQFARIRKVMRHI